MLSLLLIFKRLKPLNSAYFDEHNINHIMPGTVLKLPKHPDASEIPVEPIVIEEVIEEPIVKIIGNLTITRGTAYIIRDGNQIAAKKITGLHAGDIINTSDNTNATIVLTDDSKYDLGSNTEFSIDTYNYSSPDEPTKTEVNTSIITLLKGVVTFINR